MADIKLTQLEHLKSLATAAKKQADAVASRVTVLENVGAQPNIIETIKVNGAAQTVTDKTVNITVPTNVSALTNDKGYQTGSQVDSAIQTAISKSGHASYERVNAVPTVEEAQENILYLVMNSTTNHYDIYAKIKGTDGSFTMEQLDDTTVDLSGYVQKEAGKSLMTDAERSKLSNIAAGANAYTHPAYPAQSTGLYKFSVDGTGHVNSTTTVSKADITALGIPGSDTTYGNATSISDGLMSAADKTKLDSYSLATDAEVAAMLTEVFGS